MKYLYALILTFFVLSTMLNAQCDGGDPGTNGPGWDSGLSIEANYNNARRWEENNLGLTANCLGNMVEPNVGWGGMNEESTALYIHNSERTARGKLPLYDVESNLDGVAQAHSDWQIANGVFDHGGDPALGSDEDYKLCSDCATNITGSSPFNRMDNNSTLQGNAEWRSENIGIRVTSGNSLADYVPERVYAFIYRDAGAGWGHRHAVLHVFNNDWGDANTEGFIGVGISEGTDFDICQFGCDDNWNLAKHITIDYYDPIGSASGFTFKGLPIQLLSFDAKIINSKVLISWSTLSEINNDYFVVEKSLDGVVFEELEFIEAFGDSKSQQDYSRYDTNPDLGINYYRLKQVDFDGKIEYSKIISVIFKREEYAVISPNPIKDYIVVNSYLESNNNSIKVYNAKGGILYSSSLPQQRGETEIDLSGLRTGLYFIEIKGSDFTKIFKVVKL